MKAITLTINKKTIKCTVAEDMPLLWVLRDKLNLVGTKFGCGKGLCGACTVLINGRATRSCSIPASALTGIDITTIEGLSDDGSHPVQQAWNELDVPQCGYCQAGQILSTVSLLSYNDNPDDQAIDAALSGNICRCGTYNRIRCAVKKAAQLTAQLKEQTPKEQTQKVVMHTSAPYNEHQNSHLNETSKQNESEVTTS